MDHDCHFLGETFLQQTQVRCLGVLGDESINLVLGEGGKNLDIPLGIGVRDVEPELIELVWRGITSVEPYISALRLAELAAVGFRYQRTGKGESGLAVHLSHKLDAGGDVSPLVGAAHLHETVLVFVQIDEVVALQQLVGELSKRHSLRIFPVKTFLDGVLRHHIIDGDELAYLACEVKESEVFHPVVVIDQFRGIRCLAVEVKKTTELFLYTLLVMSECLFCEQVAFGGFA